MKKQMMAAFCAFFLLIGLLPFMAFAAVDVLFIAINDELPELTLETSPIRVGGITYLPCTIFDNRVTGVDLGVYYNWDAKSETITLYSKDRMLSFRIKEGTAYSYNEEREYAYQAIVRSGMPYVPAASSCRYFGLSCPLLITDDTEFQLLRIKNGNQVLDDTMFIRSAKPLLEERAAKYAQNSSGTSSNQQGESVKNQENSGNSNGAEAVVYFAVRVDGGQNLQSILNAMKGSFKVKGIFFFHVEQLASKDDILRQLVSNGQRIGLIANGNSVEEQLSSLGEGNRLLKHIVRQKAVFVLNEGASAEIQEGLREQGYIPWKANITVGSLNRSDASFYQTVLERIGKAKGKARVLLDDNTKGGTLSSILRQLREDQYEIRILRETDY